MSELEHALLQEIEYIMQQPPSRVLSEEQIELRRTSQIIQAMDEYIHKMPRGSLRARLRLQNILFKRWVDKHYIKNIHGLVGETRMER